MFNHEFYPTPTEVISRMLAPWMDQDLQDFHILDPSAGKGDILKQVVRVFGHAPTLHAIELDPACRTLLLAEPHIQLVHDDFLTFSTDTNYDLVLMNPPFSNGDEHLLHALEVLKHGHIVCLLNAETLRNPCTRRRILLKAILDERATVEYIGQAFAKAERPTNVEVALVRIRQEDQHAQFAFWDDAHFSRECPPVDFSEEAMSNAPAINNIVKAMVDQYDRSCDLFKKHMESLRRLEYHTQPLIDKTFTTVGRLVEEAYKNSTPERIHRSFADGLRQHAWKGVMLRTHIQNVMTARVRKDFERMQDEQGALPFTEENVCALLDLLYSNQGPILMRAVEESFDLMTRYHHKNRVHVEGWKTNDAYKVNRKVIIPDCTEFGWRGQLSVNYRMRDQLNDMDRGLGLLVGKKLDKIHTIANALSTRLEELGSLRSGSVEGNTCESEFFHIRFFKKGTVHLSFLDEALWERFNLTAAQGKNWLPMDHNHSPAPETSFPLLNA